MTTRRYVLALDQGTTGSTALVVDPDGRVRARGSAELPGARVRAERGQLAFGTVDAWRLWKLTGGSVHGTDASNASRTLCLNLKTGDWDDELLKLLGVPRAVLPVVLPSAGALAETTE